MAVARGPTWFEVWGLEFGFRGCGVGFGVWGLGFEVWGLGFGVLGLRLGVWCLGFSAWSLEFGVWSFGFRVLDFRFRILCFKFKVEAFRVSGLVSRVDQGATLSSTTPRGSLTSAFPANAIVATVSISDDLPPCSGRSSQVMTHMQGSRDTPIRKTCPPYLRA